MKYSLCFVYYFKVIITEVRQDVRPVFVRIILCFITTKLRPVQLSSLHFTLGHRCTRHPPPLAPSASLTLKDYETLGPCPSLRQHAARTRVPTNSSTNSRQRRSRRATRPSHNFTQSLAPPPPPLPALAGAAHSQRSVPMYFYYKSHYIEDF